jgi:N-acetylglucosaminyldiphosphoundecaprenol N-acetyl-beta-D-mannosaminyltransferase
VPRLMGMPLDSVTLDGAVARVLDGVALGTGGTVLAPNIDILRQYQASPQLQAEFERTNLLVADGMPIVVALRLQRTPVPHQITGTDLLWAVSAGAAARGYRIVLAGGQSGDADRAADKLRERSPALNADIRPCFVRPDTEAREIASLSEALIDTRPDIVFLGLPFRTQVSVMSELRHKLPATWFIGIGSSFELVNGDLVNGDRTRPPRWLQRLCLEWVWRLTRQPHLWRRYLVDGMPTAARLAVSALRVRWQREPKRPTVSTTRTA